MGKSKIFAEILKIVSEETEIPEETILSGTKETDVVDARFVLIELLSENGIYPTQIARMMGMTPTNVRHVISVFEDRRKTRKMLRRLYEIVGERTK